LGPPWRTSQTWVNTLKSQMIERKQVTMNSGFSTGTISDQKLRQGLAPSTRMASRSSLGMAVSPAYSVIATNGIACQTTMMVITAQVDSPVANHEWPANSPSPSVVSSQFTKPNWVSKSHCQTTVAVRAGIAQVSTRLTSTARRRPRPRRSSSRATRVARTMVRVTLTAVNSTVRSTTDQKKRSPRIDR
jgi:hypothetical protein